MSISLAPEVSGPEDRSTDPLPDTISHFGSHAKTTLDIVIEPENKDLSSKPNSGDSVYLALIREPWYIPPS